MKCEDAAVIRPLCLLPVTWLGCQVVAAQDLAAGLKTSEARKDDFFTANFPQTNHWSAGDVATSIPLSDGRVLWWFGDSYEARISSSRSRK